MGIAKLVQLFSEGKELVLGDEGAEQVVLWISKLSAFQEEQANQAGRVSRARRKLAIREVGNPQYELFLAAMGDVEVEEIVNSIAESRSSELFMRVVDDIRSDPQWRERIEVIEHTDRPADDSEKDLLAKMNAEYNSALLERHEEEMTNLRNELRDMPKEELQETYRSSYLDEQGYQAFVTEKVRWQLYFSMRSCAASPPQDGSKWDHSACRHQELYLSDVDDVDQLPPEVAARVSEAYGDLVLSPSLARFTDALPSSSDSPELSVAEADSTPSSPEGTSTEPATT